MTTTLTKAFKCDTWGHPIPGGTEINIKTFNLTDSAWESITLDSGKFCKQFIVKTWSGEDFKISDSAAGTDYITINGSLNMDFGGAYTSALLYSQSVSASDILELLYTD